MQSKQDKLLRLGLLGLGSRSTLFYLEQLNQHYNATFGVDNTCPLLLLNANFEAFNPYLPNQFERLEPILLQYLNRFRDLAIEQLIIPNITLHESYDRLNISKPLGYQIIHPVEETMQCLQTENQQNIMIFGSNYSMHSPLLKQHFNKHGINISQPKAEDMATIEAMRKLMYNNQETTQDLQTFNTLITQYAAQMPVVIACTELSIALHADTVNVYDMVKIQLQRVLY